MSQGSPSAVSDLSLRISGHGLTVRRAQAMELTDVAALLCRSFYSDQRYWSWVIPLLRLGIHQDLRVRFSEQPSQYACMVGILDTHSQPIIGTAEITLKSLSPWQLSPTVAYVSNFAVDANYRRLGVGLQLLAACEQMVRTWGQDEVYLHVLEHNDAARHLYAKAGYQPYPLRGMHEVLTRLGWPSRILMRKILC